MTQEIIDRDEVLKMAKQAGWPDWEIVGMKGELKAFAKLVEQRVRESVDPAWKQSLTYARLDEREACAKVCSDVTWDGPWKSAAIAMSNLIRARGEAT